MQIGEGAAAAVPDQPAKLVGCDWKTCEQTHEKKPSYPGGGKVERSSSFAGQWVSAGLEPWQRHGEGLDAHPGLSAAQVFGIYRSETPGADYAFGASRLQHPQYHTQKHHLVSVKLFSPHPVLKHNIELSGWDVNGLANGACFPSYTVDIVRHDLQAHRGNHSNGQYYDHIDPLVRSIAKQCVKFCVGDASGDGKAQQERLIDTLDRLSRRTYMMVKGWRWLLRVEALAERAAAFARYHTLPK